MCVLTYIYNNDSESRLTDFHVAGIHTLALGRLLSTATSLAPM